MQFVSRLEGQCSLSLPVSNRNRLLHLLLISKSIRMRQFLLGFILAALAPAIVHAQPYCTPYPGLGSCSSGDLIDDFVLVGENGTAINTIGSGCASGGYANLTAQSVNLAQGITYTAFVSTVVFPDDNLAIWIDFNDNFVFEPTERVATYDDVSTTSSPVSVVIPANATLGIHRLRAAIRADVPATAIDPCNVGPGVSEFGETHDYEVNIVSAPSCPPPSAITVGNISSNAATVSWTGNAATYRIEYGPSGFVPGNGTGTVLTTTTNTVNVTNLTNAQDYTVYVRSICSATDSSALAAITFTSGCIPYGIPYFQEFDQAIPPALPTCLLAEDANNDGNTWKVTTLQAQSAPNSIFYDNAGAVNGANDWFYLPGINVIAGGDYLITFDARTGAGAPQLLEMKVGTAQQASTMLPTAVYSSSISSPGAFTNKEIYFTAPTTGVAYFGFHVTSPAGNGSIYIDNIVVDTNDQGNLCPAVLNLTGTITSSTTATANWSAAPGATGYEYVLSNSNSLPTTAGTPIPSNSFNLTGLTPATDYYFYVRSICALNGASDWEGIAINTDVASVTGITQRQGRMQLQPNPARNDLRVSLPGKTMNGQLLMTDMQGRVLAQWPAQGAAQVVSLTSFPAGIYLLRYTDGQHSVVQNLVKE